MASNIPSEYLLQNTASTKRLAVVVQIPGVDILGSTQIFETLTYGMSGLFYGEPFGGITPVYGGLVPIPGVRDIFSFDGSSVNISQVIEPEQGRGSVSQMNLAFIDKDQYMSKVVSPGVIIPDIMGVEVNVFLGYQELPFPEGYYRIYRGYCTGVTTKSGMVVLMVSDPNVKRRQDIFANCAVTTKVLSNILAADTTINLISTGNLFREILGPLGGNDPAVLGTYIKIGDEFIKYTTPNIVSDTQIVSVTRGARGTVAADHTAGDDVSFAIELEDNCLTLALKLMLSGWDGYYQSSIPILSIGTLNTGPSGFIPNVIALPTTVDANRDYGLNPGDFINVTGSGAGNNGFYEIIELRTRGDVTNNLILVSMPGGGAVNFTPEGTTSAVFAARSQYDTLPIDAGLMMTPKDVDVARHESIRDTFMNAVPEDEFRFFETQNQAGKTFIESAIYLPMGGYSVTRQGRCSVGINRPPIADDKLLILDQDNVLEPANIQQTRATNNRKFWNDIIFNFDFDDANTATNVLENFDASSFNLIGIRMTLPIDAPGSRTDLGAQSILQKRSSLMLDRFARGAAQITLKSNWEIGSQIEAGDIVALKDDGTLQITNFATGVRDNGFQLYEVINRTLDVKTGNTSLTLISGITSTVSDKFGVVAPSSIVGTGSTTDQIQIVDSFGFAFPGDEIAKWTTYIGDHLLIHSEDFTTTYSTILTGVDELNGKFITVSPPVGAPPTAGMIVDFDYYNNDVHEDIEAKLIHCFFSQDVAIASGTSHTQFNVTPGDLAAIQPGFPVLVHNADFSIQSPETTVVSIVGTLVTVKDDLGFTPTSAMTASMFGFEDGKSCYRFI